MGAMMDEKSEVCCAFVICCTNMFEQKEQGVPIYNFTSRKEFVSPCAGVDKDNTKESAVLFTALSDVSSGALWLQVSDLLIWGLTKSVDQC